VAFMPSSAKDGLIDCTRRSPTRSPHPRIRLRFIQFRPFRTIGSLLGLTLRAITEAQVRPGPVYVVSKDRVGFGLIYSQQTRSAGIPTIIKPFFGDQFFWSDRVEALGIGSSVRKLTVENLTAALRAATTDVKQIERAKLVGESIRAVSTHIVQRTVF
jgi:hypothetical protein